jgi:hypothetical protein
VSVVPFRTRHLEPEDWLTDDETPIAVHLVSTPHEVNAVLAYLQRPTHPQLIQDAATRWLAQIRKAQA